MTELIKVIVSIKDPFTLLAFFAVVLLLAFRTKTVPESLFRLVGEKISRDRFYALMNRAFLYSFGVFLVLCGIAVLAQVLSYKTTARAASVDELRGELAGSKANAEAAQRAIAEYQNALTLARDDKLGDAIASLEASLKAVPTATARETLALLYQKAGNRDGAVRLAEQTVSEARESGDALKSAKAERLLAAVSTPLQLQSSQACPPDAGLVGAKLNLPPGANDFETSPLLVPCVYSGQSTSRARSRSTTKLHSSPAKRFGSF
jgi:tetratricopeptide (TPR) repeat protein